MSRGIGGVIDVVMGRGLWEERCQYWAGADEPFAQFIDPAQNHPVPVPRPPGRRTDAHHAPRRDQRGPPRFDETVPLTRLDLVDSLVTSVGNAVLTSTLHG